MALQRHSLTPQMLKKAVVQIFNRNYANVDASYKDIVMTVNSNVAVEDYGSWGAVPKMSELKDEVEYETIGEYAYTLRPKTYSGAIKISEDTLMDGAISQMEAQVRTLAEEGSRFNEELFWQNFETPSRGSLRGSNDTFYHSANGNLASTAAKLSEDSVQKGITAVRKLKDDKDRALRASADTLIVPPELEFLAMKIVAPDNENAGFNTLGGRLKVRVIDYLNSATAWYLVDTRNVNKPFVEQVRQRPTLSFISPDQSGDDAYSYKVRVKSRIAFGNIDPRLVYKNAGA